MKIYVCLFAYALSDDLVKAWDSINNEHTTTHLFLHSQIPHVVAACAFIAQASNVIYHPYGFNRGLARGINDTISAAFDNAADVLVCWADDITARPGDIERIACAAQEHSECSCVQGPVYVEKTQRIEIGGMAMNMNALHKVGYFDVNCHPIAFSDTDWAYRSKLAGLQRYFAGDTYLTHAGAKTRDVQPQAEDEFMRQFIATREYYIKKWGGDAGQERYTHPFNDPSLSYKIERANVNNPYPGHQWREAQE